MDSNPNSDLFTRFVNVYDSTNIVKLGWSPGTNALRVTFKNGDQYHYDGINAATFGKIVSAKSVGTAFNKVALVGYKVVE